VTDGQIASPEPVFQYSRNAGSCADAGGEDVMQVLHPRCAALDLGKDVLVAGVRLQEGAGVQRACRTYRTTRRYLLDLADWLTSLGITHVVMEATGSYWKSVWNALEGRFELTLANPAQIKNLPGRKSDVNDATWMADLHAHGLIRGSFVPPPHIAALRELTRTRKQFVREIARHTLRIQKLLDVADLKITGPISEILGVSGRRIVKALIAGETDPERLAALADPHLKASRAELVETLQGELTAQQRRLLKMHLKLIENLETAVAQIDRDIAKAVAPFRELVDRLKEVPGLSDISAPALVAEIGVDMTRFPTARHLVAWARLCPRLDESAGKVHSRRILKSAAWVKTLLVQAAWSAMRTRNSYLRAQFLRLRARRGANKAIVAVAASILTAVYCMIRDREPYRDLGFNYFQESSPDRFVRRSVARLQQLGYVVTLTRGAA
jgi:transposase